MARSVTPAPLSFREESEVPEIRRLESEAPSTVEPPSQTPAPQSLLRPSAQSSATDYFDPEGFDSYFGLLEPEDMIVVRNYKGDDEDQILEELRPRFIIMYDCDPAFVRRVEVRSPSIFPPQSSDTDQPSLILSLSGLPEFEPWFGRSSILHDVCELGGGVQVPLERDEGKVGIREIDPRERSESSRYVLMISGKLTLPSVTLQSMIIPITGDPRGAPAAPTSRIDTLAKAISTRIAGGAQEQQAEPPTVRLCCFFSLVQRVLTSVLCSHRRRLLSTCESSDQLFPLSSTPLTCSSFPSRFKSATTSFRQRCASRGRVFPI